MTANETAITIARLTRERDDARLEICLLRADSTNVTEVVSQAMADYAASRGWSDLLGGGE